MPRIIFLRMLCNPHHGYPPEAPAFVIGLRSSGRRFASGDLMCPQMRSQLFLSVENAPLDRSDGDVLRSRDLVIFPLLDKSQGQSLALAGFQESDPSVKL